MTERETLLAAWHEAQRNADAANFGSAASAHWTQVASEAWDAYIHLRAWAKSVEAADAPKTRREALPSADTERAAVVRFIRASMPRNYNDVSRAFEYLRDAIEAGQHLKAPT